MRACTCGHYKELHLREGSVCALVRVCRCSGFQRTPWPLLVRLRTSRWALRRCRGGCWELDYHTHHLTPLGHFLYR